MSLILNTVLDRIKNEFELPNIEWVNTEINKDIDNDINSYNKDNLINESYSKNIFKKLSNKILKTLF